MSPCADSSQQQQQQQQQLQQGSSCSALNVMPEGAWLRVVSQLDWPSACALSSSSGEAQQETSAARNALAETIKETNAEITAATAKHSQEEAAAEERLARQRGVLAEALLALRPLQARRASETMHQVFVELEQNQPDVLNQRAQTQASARLASLNALRAAIGAREERVRGRIAEGELRERD